MGGTPSLLRAINERTVLESVRRVGPVSRAQIARETALSKPTVSQALATLLAAGLVREAGRSSGGKGPTAVLYELNPQAGWVVGIDVGRDWLRAAIADLSRASSSRAGTSARRCESATTLITQIGEVAHALAADAGIRWRQVTFATVGSPGVFEPERGQVALGATACPAGGGRVSSRRSSRSWAPRSLFENDVNLAALGEQWHGLGKGVDNFVYLHLGHGRRDGHRPERRAVPGQRRARRARSATSRWRGPIRVDPSSRRSGRARRRGRARPASSADARRLGMAAAAHREEACSRRRAAAIAKAQAGRGGRGRADRAHGRGGRRRSSIPSS